MAGVVDDDVRAVDAEASAVVVVDAEGVFAGGVDDEGGGGAEREVVEVIAERWRRVVGEFAVVVGAVVDFRDVGDAGAGEDVVSGEQVIGVGEACDGPGGGSVEDGPPVGIDADDGDDGCGDGGGDFAEGVRGGEGVGGGGGDGVPCGAGGGVDGADARGDFHGIGAADRPGEFDG